MTTETQGDNDNKETGMTKAVDIYYYSYVRQYFVYIMANIARTIYVGVTNDLERRVYEHKNELIPGFTSQYHLDTLVYFEATNDISSAITRERQLKGWTRAKKVALIETMNAEWQDLSKEWYD